MLGGNLGSLLYGDVSVKYYGKLSQKNRSGKYMVIIRILFLKFTIKMNVVAIH